MSIKYFYLWVFSVFWWNSIFLNKYFIYFLYLFYHEKAVKLHWKIISEHLKKCNHCNEYQTDQQGAFDFIYLTCIVHYIIIFILHNHPPLCLVRRLKQAARKKSGIILLGKLFSNGDEQSLTFLSVHRTSFHMSHIYGDVYLSFNLTR